MVGERNNHRKGNHLFFETPHGAVMWRMYDEGMNDQKMGGPYHVMEVSIKNVDDRGKVLRTPPRPRPGATVGRVYADPKDVMYEVSDKLRSDGRVFELADHRFGSMVRSVSDSLIVFRGGEDWRSTIKSGRLKKEELADRLNGKGPDAVNPRIRGLLDTYVNSIYKEEGGTTHYLSDEMGAVHPADVDWVTYGADSTVLDIARHRVFRMGDGRKWGVMTSMDELRDTPVYGAMGKFFEERKILRRWDRMPNFLAVLGQVVRYGPEVTEQFLTALMGAGARFPMGLAADSAPARVPTVVLDVAGKPVVLKEFEADLEGVKKGLPGYDVPVEDKSSWLSRILRGADRKAPSVEVVGFHFPRRALRLDRHPMLMGLEEVAAMKGIMEDAKKIPTTDIMGGTMAWEDTGSLVAWARRNKSNLRALNIDRVTFRRADGKPASLTLDGDYGGGFRSRKGPHGGAGCGREAGGAEGVRGGFGGREERVAGV